MSKSHSYAVRNRYKCKITFQILDIFADIFNVYRRMGYSNGKNPIIIFTCFYTKSSCFTMMTK